MHSLAQLHLLFCSVPVEDLPRTEAAANFLSPGIRQRAADAYVEYFIKYWFEKKGHNR